ncbi:NAD(P)H-binding protein [Alcanivorax sp. 1008]|uniref:NAD(P)H-binding protein n=1 Tax=Alcanivorax sp. 1008 TaxID=2816853 RepID=UPI001D2E5CCB|nr:NAD(P)H-binding protein [Alcanivorax sp. 1008]MCC1496366.1 NAD(P)H-binding protein [Alcanivorax sp. 1008]
MSRRAVVLGATGLVGGLLLNRLLQRDEWQQITVLGRRPPELTHPKIRFVQANFDQMEDYLAEFSVDDVFCCLGTTLRQAGSKEAFIRVDLDYCVAAAEQAKSGGATRFIMVSAVNANPRALAFYARTKGLAEQQIIDKKIPLTFFMQPSLLKGARNEFRFGEQFGLKAMGVLMPLVNWTKADWLPVEAQTVADAMVAAALSDAAAGVYRLRYAKLQKYAQQLR